MKILLTGATGYIGKRLLPVLVKAGHQVVCCVRDTKRFYPEPSLAKNIQVIEVDLLKQETLKVIPNDIDCAYYLVHSMSGTRDYENLETVSAVHFRERMNNTHVTQVIYLSGIVNDNELSKHLSSRKNVEEELKKGQFGLTTLRAGIIIGSGSASFEIIRDLVEKLPIMVTPKWLRTRCQPIGISDVIKLLIGVLNNPHTFHKTYDIGGTEILTYKEMLLRFAKVRGLKRRIYTLPVMTPRLSSYWLYFVTSTSYMLATSLVDSMKVEVVAKSLEINDIVGIKPITYEEALQKAFNKIAQNEIVSSWKDSMVSGRMNFRISEFIQVPSFGCFMDIKRKKINNLEKCVDRIWHIGGSAGWYYANWLWRIRGFVDSLTGGVGLRRGRTHLTQINPGEALDFWRVLYANKQEGRLLLLAEMKLPGEAWLEFKIENDNLVQTATFRPKGLWGRIYWYLVSPFHYFVFNGMIKELTKE
ncbi:MULTISPECIES: SDR family oxidoreductase [unclassified Saccharicrinis]|uniref:SDR family oxidoreductase n=1 Tax=unclassified Saccharicrinis TaxID=2646859 RepID=UPI003D35882A